MVDNIQDIAIIISDNRRKTLYCFVLRAWRKEARHSRNGMPLFVSRDLALIYICATSSRNSWSSSESRQENILKSLNYLKDPSYYLVPKRWSLNDEYFKCIIVTQSSVKDFTMIGLDEYLSWKLSSSCIIFTPLGPNSAQSCLQEKVPDHGETSTSCGVLHSFCTL